MLTISPCPIIFSGHNERAVVALCRFFYLVDLPFFLVACQGNDAILQTDWREYVLFQRKNPILTLKLMEEIAVHLKLRDLFPVLCPTSEFLNRFVLDNRIAMEMMGWDCALPEKGLYLELSDKYRSPALIEGLAGLKAPPEQLPGQWLAPCVLKPKSNVSDFKVQYPILCEHSQDLQEALEQIRINDWFSQEWIEGQSLYLCAYLDRNGQFGCFWQQNLLQQPGGKSIVLACTTVNPGVNVKRLMANLHSMGYFGPFMMEIIRHSSGQLFFIEVNPRFWGPLNLALKACPKLLRLFAEDHGLTPKGIRQALDGSQRWYAWSYGARFGPCRKYPAAQFLTDGTEVEGLLRRYDVYGEKDTRVLHNRH